MFFRDQPLWKEGAKSRMGQKEKSTGMMAKHKLSQPTGELTSENPGHPSHNGSLDE